MRSPSPAPAFRHLLVASCGAALLAAGGPAAAETSTQPDAGSLLQQLEQNAPRAAPVPVPQRPAASAPAARPVQGTSITVTAFRFEGNRLLDDARLQAVVAPWLARPLGIQDLQDAAAAVARAYRDAGWVVRTLLPQQDVSTGVVLIRIVEARFGGTQWKGDLPQRVTPERLAAVVDAAQPTGAPLRADAIDRALLLLGELPGVSVTGDLVAGPADGETALRLAAEDKPLLGGEASLDNGGSRATGTGRALATLRLDSPARIGDQALLQWIGSRGSEYGRLDYVLPAGSAGWRVGATVSTLGYKLITSDFEALDAHGGSTAWGLLASYAAWRSRSGTLDWAFTVDHQRFDNQSAGSTISHYGVDGVSATVKAGTTDDLGGGGVIQASLGWVGGRVNLNGSPNQADDAASERTAGGFGKWCFTLSRLQNLTPGLSAQAAWAGQLANRNLDGSQKFSLGGPTGVRAYPVGEAAGSDGMMVNLGLRQVLSDQASVSAFYDWGRVRVQHVSHASNQGAVGAPANDQALQGLGLSAAWRPLAQLSLQASWSHRIGHNPNPTSTGSDQDGSFVRNRLWLQASGSF